MPIFAIIVALLMLAVLTAIVLPLLRKSGQDTTVERSEANLQILRDQLVELDADLQNGTLPQAQYESARTELERRALDESQKGATAVGSGQAGRRWLAPVLIGVLLPVVSVALYVRLGNTDGLDVEAYLQQQAASITADDVAQMTLRLEQHVEENPTDAEGWAMLGRARWALHQFDASAQAWRRAAELLPDDADVLTNYAEAVAMAAQGSLEGEPTRLLARSLELEPAHPKALALSGSAAFARNDYSAAIEHWQKLLALSSGDDQLSAALETGIAEAKARLAQAGGEARESVAVAGNVTLSPQLSQAVNPDDIVFIFARAPTGPGMPLAVARVKVGELPYSFRLDDSMAMTPERKISDFEQLVVGARVSKSGGATRASGDLEGFSATVAAGASNVQVVIDQRVP
jgi:cytochrome c-type biogenesis protein CcmH